MIGKCDLKTILKYCSLSYIPPYCSLLLPFNPGGFLRNIHLLFGDFLRNIHFLFVDFLRNIHFLFGDFLRNIDFFVVIPDLDTSFNPNTMKID